MFAYQQDALDFYAPLPAFVAMPISSELSTVQADSWKKDGCCAKCSVHCEEAIVEVSVMVLHVVQQPILF